MNKYYEYITLLGEVTSVTEMGCGFEMRLLSGDNVKIFTSGITSFEVIRNLDNLERDRVVAPERLPDEKDDAYQLRKYIKPNLMVCVQGVKSNHASAERIDAKRVVLMHSNPKSFAWEDTHWWISQVSRMCHQWLDVLFRDKRTLTVNDFAEYYRTNLNILGGQTDDNVQECATLSRLLYGLSSAYLLTGLDRFYEAAKAAAYYLCDTFRSPSHDEKYVFWKFGRRQTVNSSCDIIPSQNNDDFGTFALYEQIYALSGLTQYYRITQDPRILDTIEKTINGFQNFYLDFPARPGDPCFTGQGGYFSHIDPITMRPDAPSLDRGYGWNNRMKKNWNSIGDHIPAYLINLLLTIDPLPDGNPHWKELRTRCWSILDGCVDNILERFPQKDSSYVQERFNSDWTPDKSWGWQQDRAVVGHNLKIAWNLTRCGHYYSFRKHNLEKEGFTEEAAKYGLRAKRCYEFSKDLGRKMAQVGVDLARGGIFDAVERVPKNGMPTDFVWGCTKDFWQQEQAILAFLILHGIESEPEFLEYARYCCAFWNLFFLDRDNFKMRFRTSESGQPVIEGIYAQQAGHAMAGYHAFELSYLAHFYTRCYVEKATGSDDNFVLYFRPNHLDNDRSINVMPDFVRTDEVEIVRVKINGEVVEGLVQDGFQIRLPNIALDSLVSVEFDPKRRLVKQAAHSDSRA